MSDSQLAVARKDLKEMLASPAYKNRFEEVLGTRAPQFMASIVSIAGQENLAACEPKSVIASAMIAATLDLPIEKSLGFAHIVPYKGIAQFQMAAKGYVQLAMRSGQYQRMNARPVNKEAFRGYDDVGEPIIDWDLLDEEGDIIGYAFAYRLNNGFTKVAYWSKKRVEDHAARFSQAVKGNKKDSPWFTNFDKMALKTVVMNELRAWGVLSIQMQTAVVHDMGAQADIDAEVTYPDSTTDGEKTEAAKRPPPPSRSGKGATGAAENGGKAEPKNVTPPATTETSPPPAAGATTEPKAPKTMIADKEKGDFKCEVVSVVGLNIKVGSSLTPSVQAVVKGEFEGTVYHRGAGTLVAAESGKPEDATVTPNAEWTPGKVLVLSLLGRGKMVSVEALKEAAPVVEMSE